MNNNSNVFNKGYKLSGFKHFNLKTSLSVSAFKKERCQSFPGNKQRFFPICDGSEKAKLIHANRSIYGKQHKNDCEE
jgi:hypothetical protein